MSFALMDVVVVMPLFTSILNFWAVAFSLSVLSVFSLSVSVATLDVEYMLVGRALHKEGSALFSEICPPHIGSSPSLGGSQRAQHQGKIQYAGTLESFLVHGFFLSLIKVY